MLVDPGAGGGPLAGIGRVDVVLLTHVHEAHFRSLPMFPDAEVWAPAAEADSMEDIESLVRAYQASGDPVLEPLFAEWLRRDFNYQARRVARRLRGDERLELGGVAVDLIPLPGHTPGMLGFRVPAADLLCLADVDLTRFGPFYADAGASIEATLRTAVALEAERAEVHATGHEMGLVREGFPELLRRWRAVIWERDAKLLDLLATPATRARITEAYIVYRKPREPRWMYDFLEWCMMEKHLQRLLAQGQVVQADAGWLRR